MAILIWTGSNPKGEKSPKLTRMVADMHQLSNKKIPTLGIHPVGFTWAEAVTWKEKKKRGAVKKTLSRTHIPASIFPNNPHRCILQNQGIAMNCWDVLSRSLFKKSKFAALPANLLDVAQARSGTRYVPWAADEGWPVFKHVSNGQNSWKAKLAKSGLGYTDVYGMLMRKLSNMLKELKRYITLIHIDIT